MGELGGSVVNRIVFHVDMDAFFVAVERRADPSLEGRAVIVGGSPNGRGVVCSASYEARRKGVRSAMPSARALRLCPEAVFIPVGKSDYAAASEEVRALWGELTPVIETLSLDEAYLEMTGTERLHGPAMEVADALLRRTRESLGLPCSIGVAENKLLAKVASTLAKPLGILRVPTGSGPAFLAPLSLRRLPGIGPKMEERLARYGLETLGDLVALGREELAVALGEMGEALWRKARGGDETPTRSNEPARSISRETTFEDDTTDPRRIEATLSALSESVAAALRRERLAARTVTVKLRYSDFQTLTRSVTLDEPTDDDRIIFREVLRRFHGAHHRRVRLRLLGVAASGLGEAQWQFDLFEAETQARRIRLNQAIDRIRSRHQGQAIPRRARSLGFPPPRRGSNYPPGRTGGKTF